MHQYQDTQLSPYSTPQIFDLVMDIERYPEFLPWCRAARILERGEGRVTAELVVHFAPLTESYVSEVIFTQPRTAQEDGAIEARLLRGPFRHLSNLWKLKALPSGGTEITLHLAFQFRSRILDSLVGALFGKATAKMARAFTERADELYALKS